jgi:hypothetical protein
MDGTNWIVINFQLFLPLQFYIPTLNLPLMCKYQNHPTFVNFTIKDLLGHEGAVGGLSTLDLKATHK